MKKTLQFASSWYVIYMRLNIFNHLAPIGWHKVKQILIDLSSPTCLCLVESNSIKLKGTKITNPLQFKLDLDQIYT